MGATLPPRFADAGDKPRRSRATAPTRTRADLKGRSQAPTPRAWLARPDSSEIVASTLAQNRGLPYAMLMATIEKATFFVRGNVQTVGFRWWTRARAKELGLVGYARNLDDGRVEVCAQGDVDDVETLERLLSERPSQSGRPGRVLGITAQWGGLRSDLTDFTEQ